MTGRERVTEPEAVTGREGVTEPERVTGRERLTEPEGVTRPESAKNEKGLAGGASPVLQEVESVEESDLSTGQTGLPTNPQAERRKAPHKSKKSWE